MDDNNPDLFSKQDQNNENSMKNVSKAGDEPAGSILRKERVTKRITIDSISKDLKINSSYIKAIEENNYDALPADPYVRVYIKSIASYLMLNPDEILDKFYKERGIRPSSLDKKQTQKIDVTEDKKNTSPLTWIVIISIIAILAVLSYIGNRYGLFNTERSAGKNLTAPDTSLIESSHPSDTSVYPDSTGMIPPDDSVSAIEDNETINSDDVQKPDSLSLKISVDKDSVWAQVFCDGKSWKNFLYKDEERVFTAVDSINANIGKGSRVNLHFNGSPVELEKTGVVTLKADSNGIDLWPLSKWKTVFKNRI